MGIYEVDSHWIFYCNMGICMHNGYIVAKGYHLIGYLPFLEKSKGCDCVHSSVYLTKSSY